MEGYTVRLTHRARNDLLHILEYLHDLEIDGAPKCDRILDALQTLSMNPFRHRRIATSLCSKVRIFPIENTLALYRVLDNEVEVLAILAYGQSFDRVLRELEFE